MHQQNNLSPLARQLVSYLLPLFFVALLFAPLGQAQASSSSQDPNAHSTTNAPVVNLQAEARVEVPQDTVQFVLFVQKEGDDQQTITQEVNQVLNQALEQAQQLAKDHEIQITTGSFSVSPRYGDNGKIASWQARAELNLESKEIDQTAELAGQLSDLLSIARVNFSLSQAERARQEEALTKDAIKAFEQRAQLMSESLSYDYYRLKELFIDSSAVVFRPQAQMAQESMMVASSAPQPKVAVAAGLEEVSVQVRGAIFLLDKKDTCQ